MTKNKCETICLGRCRPTYLTNFRSIWSGLLCHLRRHLVHQDEPISHVCFIESGLASVVATSSHGKTAEIRHVGREGVTGYQVIMAVDRAATETFMQMEGDGILVPVEPFLQAVKETSIRDFFLRYAHTLRIPTKPAIDSDLKPASHSDFIPAGVPI